MPSTLQQFCRACIMVEFCSHTYVLVASPSASYFSFGSHEGRAGKSKQEHTRAELVSLGNLLVCVLCDHFSENLGNFLSLLTLLIHDRRITERRGWLPGRPPDCLPQGLAWHLSDGFSLGSQWHSLSLLLSFSIRPQCSMVIMSSGQGLGGWKGDTALSQRLLSG